MLVSPGQVDVTTLLFIGEVTGEGTVGVCWYNSLTNFMYMNIFMSDVRRQQFSWEEFEYNRFIISDDNENTIN